MAKSTKVLDVIEDKLMPLATVVGKNKYLITLRDTFAAIMPLIIAGSIFTLIKSFPVTEWTNFLTGTKLGSMSLSDLINVPASCTLSMLALFTAFLIGYNFAEHEKLSDRLSAGLVSLVSWFMLMPQFTAFTPEGSTEVFNVASIPTGWIGSKGVFVAIVAGFLSVKLYGTFVKKGFTIKMPEGTPPSVARSFAALIPASIAMVATLVVRLVFAVSPWGDAFSFIYSFLQIPLQNLGGTVFAQAGVYLFAHFLWFFGIHGTNITDAVYAPILLSLSEQNSAAIAAGLEPMNIINHQFQACFAKYGGAGSTLSLVIAMMLFCKSKRITMLGRLSIAPGIFNINEPIMFGLPMVLNPIMLIPFLLCPMINIFGSWAVMAAGLVPVASGPILTWSTPAILSGFLLAGWQGAVLQVVLIIIGVFVYLPFIKTLDRQHLAEEAAALEESSKSELDDIDLDSLDLDTL